MSTLMLSVHALSDADETPEVYARRITEGLDVTYEITDSASENAVFTGSLDDLETIVWRYVTPIEIYNRGEWTTPDNASDDDRQDFEHFSCFMSE